AKRAWRGRTDAGRRRIEEDHARPMHQRGREREPLLPAAGELAREPIAIRPDVREIDRPFHPLFSFGAFEAIDRAEEIEILVNRQIAIKRERLRDVADVLANELSIFLDVVAVDGRVAFRRHEQAAEDADERRFAGAVRTEQTEDFAARNLQRDVVERAKRAEVFRDVLHVDADLGAHALPFTPRSTSAA